jgi:PAS domain S-box-containing protein
MARLNLPQQQTKPLAISHYAVAVLSVVLAIITAELMRRLVHAEPTALLLLLCAVIVAAWFGGFGPALLTVALALLAFYYYLLPPINTFTWKNNLLSVPVAEAPRLVLFSIAYLFVAFVISMQRNATESFRRSRDELQEAIENQKRVENALLHSEMYLTEAQRLSGTGSFGWNLASGEIVWSDETFRIFGYDRATKPSLELIVQRTHPDDRTAVQNTIDRASREGRDFDHEYRLLMPDGSVKNVHAVAHAVRNASGSIEFAGAVTDVTALQGAIDEIRKSEDRLRLVIDTIPTLVWRSEPNGRPEFFNQPASRWIAPWRDGLARFIRTIWKTCRRCGAGFGIPARGARRKEGSCASTANIAGFYSALTHCAMKSAISSIGTGRRPTSRTADKPKMLCARAKRIWPRPSD